ncbi:glycosyltransferase [Pseudoalteromonas lipolytica]|jgi:glycosyltransferase involved in cell wall biosynthesis
MSNKVLVIAHGHPEFNKGGGEQAAYQFFHECLAQGDDAYFLARTDILPHGGAAFSTIKSNREILFHTTHDDFFLFSNIKTRHLWGDFAELLKQIAPKIIYCHHYFFLGVEILKVIKNVLPDCKLVLTLHEYYAICNNAGLMLKTEQNKLCYQSGTRECNQCFPNKSPGDFFLRKRYLLDCFSCVDVFIAPSAFLKQRYVEWGLPENIIHVIENGQNNVHTEGVVSSQIESDKVNITYIGQINRYKGLDVLLNALLLIPKESRSRFCIDIHGANFSFQPSEFQMEVQKQLKRLNGIVRMHGSYEPTELASILQDTHWVIVPSVWWENSPMVIQEALNYGKPVIVSDIGGMAEKVTHESTGLHFRAGNPVSLADTLLQILNNPLLCSELAKNIKAPITISETYKIINKLVGF